MGSFLGDVTKTIGAVVKAEQGDLTDLGNIVQGKPTVAEQQQNLFDQLTKQTMQPTPGMPETSTQMQMSPEMMVAKQQRDLPGFLKAAKAQQGLGNFEMSVRANPSLTQDQKDVLLSARQSGLPINELYKMQADLMGKTEAQKQKERKAQAVEAKSLPSLAKQFAQERPNATEADWLGWLALNKVDPKKAPEVLKGLQATGIYKEQPGFFSRIIDMFKGAVAAPSTQSKGFSIKKLE